MRLMSKRISCLCLLLIFWSAIAFVAHHHSDASKSAKCTVCVAAHSASPTTPTLSPCVTFVAVSTFREDPVVSSKQRLIVFALTVRPPPQV
jgi:hypothetical protein